MRIPLRRAIGALTVAAVTFGATASTYAQNLIGFDWSTSAATAIPQNWTRISAPEGTISNVPDETGAASGVNIDFGGMGPTSPNGFVYLSTSTLAADAVPQYSYDLSGMTGYGFRSGGQFFVELSGLVPDAPYEYWFVAYRSTSAIQQNVNVSVGDTPNATTFTQSISSTANNGRFLVNTVNANSSMNWNDLSLVTTSSSNGTIRFEWAGDGQTTVIGALAVRLVPEPGMLSLFAAGPLLLLRRRR